MVRTVDRGRTAGTAVVALTLWCGMLAIPSEAAADAARGRTIVGTQRGDVLVGTPGSDTIYGLSGNDVIAGLGGDDVVIAGPGDDVAFGGVGDDVLLGGGGTDRLSGDLGEDELYTSDATRDLAVGGAGRDRAWSDGVDQVYVEVGVVIAKPIVFQRLDVQIFDSDVWSTNLDGSVQTNLTNDVGLDQADPALSPFGTRIAYTQEEQDAQGSLVGSDIWVMNIDGSGATNLTPNTPGFDLDPAWSPDGTKIAFTSDGLAEIYVMNADGSNVTRLTFDQDVDEDPTWSPDGTRIAFTSGPFDGPGVFDVWVVNADGTGLHQLTSDAAVDAYPDWGPDGRIAGAGAGAGSRRRRAGSGR